MKKTKLPASTAVWLLSLLLSACSPTTVQLTASFTDAKGISQGAGVYFLGVKIGEVSDIAIRDNRSVVSMNVEKEQSSKIMQGAAVTLDGNPVTANIHNPGQAGQAVEDGAKLKGLNSPLELAAWQAGSTLGSFGKSLSDAAESLDSYFSGEEWQAAKQDMDEILQELGEQSQGALDQLQQDYLSFIESLETQSETARENAEENLRKLEQKLRELGEEGEQNLNTLLEQLREHLNGAAEKKRGDEPI